MARELIELLDNRLSKLAKDSTETEIAYELGYFDSMEHLTGLGFVACQTFMAAIYGISKIDKRKALSVGPKHSCGSTIAAITNAADTGSTIMSGYLINPLSKEKLLKKCLRVLDFL